MSAIFYTYRGGKKETSYKYEDVKKIWYTKDKKNKDQISITIGDHIYSSWDLDYEDITLTQESHEKACESYNQSLLKIGKKRKRSDTQSLITNRKTSKNSNNGDSWNVTTSHKRKRRKLKK